MKAGDTRKGIPEQTFFLPDYTQWAAVVNLVPVDDKLLLMQKLVVIHFAKQEQAKKISGLSVDAKEQQQQFYREHPEYDIRSQNEKKE